MEAVLLVAGKMKTKAFFTQDDSARVKAAIDLAYARSGCDITIVVSDDSGRYDRAEDVFGVCLSAAILTLCWFGLPVLQSTNSNSWEIQNAAILSLPVILMIMFGGFALGAFLATIFPPLKTLFVARQEMAEEVAKAAESFFYTQGLRYAKHGAGILIFVSRFEHRVHLMEMMLHPNT